MNSRDPLASYRKGMLKLVKLANFLRIACNESVDISPESIIYDYRVIYNQQLALIEREC